MTKVQARELPPERRVQILSSAARVIRERGLEGTRLSDVGNAVGMSASNLMYYFRSKEQLLSETIEWADEAYYDLLFSEFARLPGPKERLVHMIERVFPASSGIPSDWTLWLEVSLRATRDPEFASLGARLDQRWTATLRGLLRDGVRTGDFTLDDVDGFAVMLAALIDGLAIRVLSGFGPTYRQAVNACLRLVAEHLGFEPPPRARRRSLS